MSLAVSPQRRVNAADFTLVLVALTWLVASGARLPLFDASQQRVFVLFTRLFTDDIARVLKPGGELIVVGTGEQHLLPLREALYEEVRQSGFDAD